MKQISTIVIGAGQAGLAMSRALSERSEPHIVLERGDVANSWRTERWDSLRLLTPNWQSRIPGQTYAGPDPDGFMSIPEITRFLSRYATGISAPLETGTTVLSVTRDANGYRILTNRGDWSSRNLVLANGACGQPVIPRLAAGLPQNIYQLTPNSYKSPDQLAPGGVLVVGASATGVQLASEICAAGHDVVLSAGHHIRMPRFYRGRDVQWWMDRSGLLAASIDEVDDVSRLRNVPSLQLVGDSSARFLDLNRLQANGVEIVGRLAGLRDSMALFSGALANTVMLSDLKMNRTLEHFDAWAEGTDLAGLLAPERFDPTQLPANPRLTLELGRGRISTIIWATGFQPDFRWLHLPVFDWRGRIVHERGVVAPGLYILGLPFLRTRKSSLIDGVGSDAEALADHLVRAQVTQAA